ncbi:MAG: hypothetical protein OEY59_09750 [Deltaproteobacteria bacterium]|nr:hypothetical protein [Deltaproteobacteria bacterium]
MEPSVPLSIEIQVEVLSPVLGKQIEKLAKIYTQTLKIDLTKYHWWFISDERTKTDFEKPYVIEKGLEGFQRFFQQKKDLYYFLDLPVAGIVNKEPKFWVFFDPKLASSYFFKQGEKPEKFESSMIKKFPPQSISKILVEAIQPIFDDRGERPVLRVKKIEEILAIADNYMPEDEAKQFTETIRKILLTLSLMEINELKTDITNAGVSPTSLEKRLNAIFRICVRLYASNAVEKESLKKLLSPTIQIRKKALDLISMRLEKDLKT